MVSRCETKGSYRYSVRGDVHNWDTRGSFGYRKVESVMPSIQLRRIARRRNSSSKKVSFNEAAKSIAEGVRGNWVSRWWLKPEYLEGRYDRGEVEHAFDEVLRVFDHEWLESLMSKFAEGRARDHFYLRQFIGEGLYPLAILFSLGQDLLAIKSLEAYDQLKERLRSDVGWMSAAFEAEFAAHCVRKGLEDELFLTRSELEEYAGSRRGNKMLTLVLEDVKKYVVPLRLDKSITMAGQYMTKTMLKSLRANAY